MALAVDHVFVLTDPGAPEADRLIEHGLVESHSRVHPGQGTANRVFRFQNVALEFLWIHDEQEAATGRAKDLRLVDRLHTAGASLFGLIFRDDAPNPEGMPFVGWSYQPQYFPASMSFHIGENSQLLDEPLCIHAPFTIPQQTSAGNAGVLVKLLVTVPKQPSAPLRRAGQIPSLEIVHAPSPLMELNIKGATESLELDLAPALPLRLSISGGSFAGSGPETSR